MVRQLHIYDHDKNDTAEFIGSNSMENNGQLKIQNPLKEMNKVHAFFHIRHTKVCSCHSYK